MTTGAQPICYSCIHKDKGLFCDAFPDGIPVPILLNEVDHRKPYQGDHQIQFEQNRAKPEPGPAVLEHLDSL